MPGSVTHLWWNCGGPVTLQVLKENPGADLLTMSATPPFAHDGGMQA